MMNVKSLCRCRTLILLLSAIGAAPGSEDGWAMTVQPEVRAVAGDPAVLPCSFSHPPHSPHSGLQVLWRLGRGPEALTLYRCTSTPAAPACQPGPRQDRRYRLEGDPRQHVLSLRISSAALRDNGRYYCRVEVQGQQRVALEDRAGTRLRVEAPPRILALTLEGSERAGFTAACRVQGSPLPEVQWLRPQEPPREPDDARGPESDFHAVSRLPDVAAGHRYTCSTSNPLGRDRASLYLLAPRGQAEPGAPPAVLLLLAASLGAKVLLLGAGLALAGRRVLPVSSWRGAPVHR